MEPKIPHALLHDIERGRAVLLLGAGATFGAIHPEGKNPPLGNQLSDLMADRFLGPAHRGRTLAEVAELAASETDRTTVEEFIKELFDPFQPADFHKLIPSFSWPAIFTTNYDLVIERAYQAVENASQRLVPFITDEDRVEEALRDQKAVAYIKLHGCISRIRTSDPPLILTIDQYVTHRSRRELLFNRLTEQAYNYSIIFAGNRLADNDLRAVLLQVSSMKESRPRSYLIDPKILPEDERLWTSRKVTPLRMAFSVFMTELDKSISHNKRTLSPFTARTEDPLTLRLSRDPTPNLTAFLSRDVDHVHSNLRTTPPDPSSFYSGHFTDWSPIVHDLDIPRRISDKILTEAVIDGSEKNRPAQQFYLLKGPGGSGKTVTLHRMAWRTAVELDSLALAVKSHGSLDVSAISELAELVGARIFLFVDQAPAHNSVLQEVLATSRRDRFPLTVIATARQAEWNDSCDRLEPYVTATYNLEHLREDEIDDLLQKLEAHKCLGHLSSLSTEERRNAFRERAGRQLLVALHEATRGKPFEEIVLDEYRSISDINAQSLYLTVAILHRLNIPVRAGLISRIHDLPFLEFQERLFRPLEKLVFAEKEPRIRDHVYRTRHPHVAEILFERALPEPTERLGEYLRIFSALDIGYEADRTALKLLSKAKELVRLFPEHSQRRSLLDTARERFPYEASVVQQSAILEMQAGEEGDLILAQQYLEQAAQLSPRDRTVQHSQAELYLRMYENEPLVLRKKHWRSMSKRIVDELIQKEERSSHPYHTAVKIGLTELEEVFQEGDEATIERKIRDIERLLAKAKEKIGQDSYLFDAESKLAQKIADWPRAKKAIGKAYERNPQSGYLAINLSRQYENEGARDKAIEVLRNNLNENPSDKNVHYRLGVLLLDSGNGSLGDAKHHLRKAFTRGDTRYTEQCRYAQALFLDGDHEAASQFFDELRYAPVSMFERRRVRATAMSNGAAQDFAGKIVRFDGTTGQIREERNGWRVFFKRRDMINAPSHTLEGRLVVFNLSFNYFGPIATHIRVSIQAAR